MARRMSITETRNYLTQLPEELEKSHEVIEVTRNSEPKLAIMSWDVYRATRETLEIMKDPAGHSAFGGRASHSVGRGREATRVVTYRIVVTESGLETLALITDRRIQEHLKERIRGLARDPLLQGEPLHDEFIGFRALHVLGNRFRIIYRVEQETVTVIVVAMGIRKEGGKTDIYEVLRRYVRLGIVEPPKKKRKSKKKPR